MKTYVLILLIIASLLWYGCGNDKLEYAKDADKNGHISPTKITTEANQKVLNELPFSNTEDFDQATKGFIAKDDALVIKNQEGKVIWDMTAYDFIKDDAPPSVNPSFWRQEKLNSLHGLFKVTEGIYQVRGYDFANLTLIKGEKGWILVDPLTAKETAAKAIAFAREHLDSKPITGIIFTHSHADHFGGALGVISPAEAKKTNVRVIAPVGFVEEATSENIIAGPAMIRRTTYQYGGHLARTERGNVGSGLGKGPAYGIVGILKPTDIIDRTPTELTIDGVKFVFQNAPGSEAPAELTFYLPEKKAYCGGEVVTRHMHNIYTLRGTKVRDAKAWSHYIDEAIFMFGQAEIYFGTHHWPIWGNSKIVDFLKKQRDTYKYIHDQTLRLANSGKTPLEIAEEIKMPESLRTTFSSRGYYGTLRHNARAVYQAYYGWYDANPANLNKLPPVESAKRYVEFMGGAQSIIKKATDSFEKGDYRWVAEVLNHLVFAEPSNDAAKSLLANTYDQLGYQAESGPWRNVYLTGAHELRNGKPEEGFDMANAKEMLRHAPIERFMDAIAVRLNGPKADGVELKINFTISDLNLNYVLDIENAVLHPRQRTKDLKADASITLTHDLFLNLVLGKLNLKETIFSDALKIEGSKLKLLQFFRLLEKPDTMFNIVTP